MLKLVGTGPPETETAGLDQVSRKNPGQATRGLSQDISAVIKEITALTSQLDPRARERARQRLTPPVEQLRQAVDALDPTLRPLSLFDPGDPQTAGHIIALTAAAQPRHALANLKPFYGAGVYLLYYSGSFAPYVGLSETEQPIYVGKANPADPHADTAVGQGKALYDRLMEHKKSILAASTTLSTEGFDCRFLLVQSGFQESAETHLINFFRPIWNNQTRICYGIGKHGDSSKTRGNKRSPWDTLHPGRTWAENTTEDQKPYEQILEEIADHLERYPPKSSLTQIIESFLEELRQMEDSVFRDMPGELQDVDAKEVEDVLSEGESGGALF